MVKKLLVGLLLSSLLAGCGSLFYWPEPGLRGTPDQLGIAYQDIYLHTDNGIRLHGWLLPANDQPARGLIYFLHGNAENISTHFAAMNWVTSHGWDLFILDYRGYGLSEGKPGLKGVQHDALTGLRWALEHAQDQQIPVVLFGQSIGASTAATLASRAPQAAQLSGLILDSPFADYRRIAREKAAGHWLTWPLQHPLSWTFSNSYSPRHSIRQLPAMPLLILHSCADPVIDCQHSKDLYALAAEPKEYWQDEQAAHISMLNQLNWRRRLLQWLEQYIDSPAGTGQTEG